MRKNNGKLASSLQKFKNQTNWCDLGKFDTLKGISVAKSTSVHNIVDVLRCPNSDIGLPMNRRHFRCSEQSSIFCEGNEKSQRIRALKLKYKWVSEDLIKTKLPACQWVE